MTRSENFTKNIPNFLTLMSLCSGFVSIIFVCNEAIFSAALFIMIAAVFDFFDGFAARALHATSDKGKVLDSVSDVVSFGAAPSALIFLLVKVSLSHSNLDFSFSSASFTDLLFLFSPLIFLVASAWRLAEFTVQKDSLSFHGLPTPPASMFFAGLALIISEPENSRIADFLLELYFIIPACLLISLLMISKIRFISLKFKESGFRQNILKYILILISIVMLILFKKFAISLIIVIYILLSIIVHFIKKPSVL